MKKLSIILMSFVLVMALSQCKKENQATSNEENTMTITLRVNGNGNSKVDVNTATGYVNFENGDKIYVASNGTYVGFITYDGTVFSGNITNPTAGQPLHFYFLGNVTPAETFSVGTTTSCSVNISEQTNNLPVISYAPSVENYTSSTTNFTAELLNKCALVKFNVTTSSSSATCIKGLNNKVTIDFSNNGFTYSQDTDGGLIKLPAGNGEKWGILLPQEALGAGAIGTVCSLDGAYHGTRPAIPAITESAYMVDGLNVSVTTSTTPTYAIGDLYPNAENPEGVVYYVYSNGTHGKIVSLIHTNVKWDSRDYATNYFIYATSLTNGSFNTNKMSYSYHPIKAWIVDNFGSGSGWYCPARDELSTLFGQRETINATLTNNGYSYIPSGIHWSSTENNDDINGYTAWVVFQNYGVTYVDRLNKDYVYEVRAIKQF